MSKKILEELLVLIEDFIQWAPPPEQNYLRQRSHKIHTMIYPKKKAVKKEKEPFRKPTILEVTQYCLSRKNDIEPQAFLDFYESKGWKVGNSAMKDWMAAVRNWERRDQPPKRRSGRFTPEISVQEACPEPEGETGVPDNISEMIKQKGLK